MTANDDEDRIAAVTRKLVDICETATAQQYRNRLEVNVIIGAYLEKRFKERFPEEHAAWLKEQP